jgi:ABC-type Fe3+/spermidine/putrescine transport system ATPase subunit
MLGRPERIFHASATRFVAEFMGDSYSLTGRGAPGVIQTALGLLPQPAALHAARRSSLP